MDEVLSDEVRTIGSDEYRIRFVLTDVLPPIENATTGIGFVFRDEALLLIENQKYGWTVPGGHIEYSETPAQAMCREVLEETSVHVGNHRLFGCQEIRILTDPIPAAHKYPVPSYQCFFVGLASRVDPFVPNDEVADAGFFVPGDVEFSKWVDNEGALMSTLYERAHERLSQLR